MDTGSMDGEAADVEAPRWARMATLAERVGFGAAAVAYVLPFFYQLQGEGASVFTSSYRYGVELFIASIFYLAGAGWPLGVQAFAGFTLPLLMATAGLLLQMLSGRFGALARFFCAVAGLSGLVSVYLGQQVSWQLGFYVVAAGFVVATVGAGLRSVAAFRDPPE